ncbi:hypothetical protein GLOIN_2v1616024 [Rhizophagus clarus]|uniref:Transmembrane protein 198 n=1 Tax=Rhizophagus clarus TaxID=94130 RepID=A0A8H3QGZ8_9GLOM|nr:hypothetical protein GLOIN_2v1616024 [Rhizophagus clarus]
MSNKTSSSRENVTKNTNMNEPKKTNRLIMENRLRIRTSDGKAYEVDRWCPHANSDLASRGVILGSKLICTKHSWAFSLDQGGKCTSADATINACSINDCAQNNNDPTLGIGNQNGSLTPHQIVTGVILIVTGIIFCFFGRRVYKLTLFLIGFYIGTIIAWIVISNAGGFKSAAGETILLIVSLAIGFVVGSIFMCCSSVAIWLLGALAGYAFALFILAWRSDGLIHSNAGTAFIGAYAIILGIDLFVRTGFAQSVRAFLDRNDDTPYATNTKVYLMLAGMLGFFIVGSLFQFSYHRNIQFGPGDGSVNPETGKKRFQFPWRKV